VKTSSGAFTAMIEPQKSAVCDAGPLIHLDELDCLDLLGDFAQILVPNTVWKEAERHRPHALATPTLRLERRLSPSPSAELDALAALFALHPGEREALSLTTEIGGSALLLTDDTAARLAAKALGIGVHGSIGVIVRAIRRRQRRKVEVVGGKLYRPLKSPR